VYFAQTGEPKGGVGDEPVSLVRSTDGGATWTRTTIDTSAEPPVCTFKGCYADFYSSQAVVASDVSGKLAFTYLKSTVDGGAKSLYVRTSSNGTSWSAPILVNARGDSNMPAIAAGPDRGRLPVDVAGQPKRCERLEHVVLADDERRRGVVGALPAVESRLHVPFRRLRRARGRFLRNELRHLG
jgi:hypothetical protein